ncbi:MAG: methyltransferase domain-containing protein [Acidobacteriaceae bacterium]
MVFGMLTALQQSAALATAIDLDVFRAVGEGVGDVASIAKHCGASERGMRILCDFLTIHGVLTKQDGRYGHSEMSAAFLDPRSPACVASVAKFVYTPMMRDTYGHLTEIVRAGRTVLPGEGSVEPNNPAWVEFAKSMGCWMRPMADPLCEMVTQGQTGPMEVLDIAAGHGLFGIAFAKQNPEAHVTAVDWAAVLEVAAENARNAGVADRYKRLPGSAFEVEYGGPYDVALLTNFLHHFDVPTNVELLKKVHAALKPGGRAVALEFMPNEDRVSPPPAASFAMTMLATTASGDAYPFSELKKMYEAAGFREVTSQAVPMGAHSAVIGVK